MRLLLSSLGVLFAFSSDLLKPCRVYLEDWPLPLLEGGHMILLRLDLSIWQAEMLVHQLLLCRGLSTHPSRLYR